MWISYGHSRALRLDARGGVVDLRAPPVHPFWTSPEGDVDLFPPWWKKMPATDRSVSLARTRISIAGSTGEPRARPGRPTHLWPPVRRRRPEESTTPKDRCSRQSSALCMSPRASESVPHPEGKLPGIRVSVSAAGRAAFNPCRASVGNTCWTRVPHGSNTGPNTDAPVADLRQFPTVRCISVTPCNATVAGLPQSQHAPLRLGYKCSVTRGQCDGL